MELTPHPPTLYLLPVPLAEGTTQQVLSPEVLGVIPTLDTFFAENIRTARRFISSLQLGIAIDSLTFYELTKDTPLADTRQQLSRLNKSAGVISEAGCPGVADPGANAVAVAHQLGWRVRPLVGPSSILLALMASGFSGQQFAFHGYLPIDKQERMAAIKKLEREAVTKRQTQIFMETPYRNNQLIESLLNYLLPDSLLTIAADITGENELITTKTVAEWRKKFPNLHKIPTIFLIGTIGNRI